MKNLTYSLILFFVSIGTSMNACRCGKILSFCEGVAPDSEVVKIEVVKKYGTFPITYMDVKVREQIQGTNTHDTLTMINYGSSCDVTFEQFAIGQKIVTSFTELAPREEDANFPIFTFRNCPVPFLKLSGNELTGQVEPGVDAMKYDDFKKNIGTCGDLKNFIRIRPNPTPNITYIYLGSLNPSFVSYELFNATGQLMTSTALTEETDSNYPLDLSRMAGGFYFIRIKYRNASIVRKIVKVNG